MSRQPAPIGSRRVALLGGSFDPVHVAHLHIAEVVLATGRYDQVLLVPAHLPSRPSAACLAAGEHRLAMLRLAIAGRPGFAVSDLELRRGGVSYTVDTVRELQRARLVSAHPGLVVGDDLGPELNSWREAPALLAMVELLVARRSPRPAALALPHRALGNHLLPLSSSAVRARVRAGKVIRFLVPDAVAAYITEHNLYGTDYGH